MAKLLPTIAILAAAYLALVCVGPAFISSPRGRRAAVAGVATAVAGGQAALADWQGETLTCLKRYGPPILSLDAKVQAGDMKAVLAKENKFKLLNTYWRNSPEDFAQQTELSENLLDAAADGQMDKVKTLYAKYMEKQELKVFAALPPGNRYHMTNADASMGAPGGLR